MGKNPKRPKDANKLAKRIVDQATGAASEEKPASLTPDQEFARSGGLMGGKARAASLTSDRRAEIARKAAVKRWERIL
jgi:hypothetical protein